MNLEQIGAFVADKGFAMFVAVYLLVRGDQLIREQSNTLRELKAFLEAHLTK